MSQPGLRILVVHPVEDTRLEIERGLRAIADGPISVHHASTPNEALREARWLDPGIVFLDLAEERTLALEAARELRDAGRLIAGLYNPLLERDAEGELFRRAARAGVGDFVPLPAAESELAQVLAAAPAAEARAPRGRTVAFLSAKGGAGTTTLAVNTALLLAGSGQAGEVALVDAALQFGDAAALLGLSPDRDLADLVAELDETVALSSYLLRHEATGLWLLPRPRELAAAETITPEAMSRVLIRLGRRFDHVVVDAPPVLDLMTFAVLDLADRVVVVTDAPAPSVVATGRLLRLLESQGFAPERLRVVVNRNRSFDGNLPLETIAAELDRQIDHAVDHEAAIAVAAHRGEPMVLARPRGRHKSTFADAIGRIAQDVVTEHRF